MLDWDLQFAAEQTVAFQGSLRELRRECLGPLRELKRWWARVGVHLTTQQTPEIRRVTAQRDLGLVGLFGILLSWPDTSLLVRHASGGHFPPLRSVPTAALSRHPPYHVLADASRHNSAIRALMRPGPHDDFLLEQSTKDYDDYDSGFCTPPLRWAELLRHVKGKPFRLIPRCVITQASGKKRVIDNADHGGQSELSSDANKLVVCSALRPAQHIAVTMRSRLLEEDQWEGGGEDWPLPYGSRAVFVLAWSSGGTRIGNSRHTRYILGCCSAYLWQSRASID